MSITHCAPFVDEYAHSFLPMQQEAGGKGLTVLSKNVLISVDIIGF